MVDKGSVSGLKTEMGIERGILEIHCKHSYTDKFGGVSKLYQPALSHAVIIFLSQQFLIMGPERWSDYKSSFLELDSWKI